MCSEFSQIFQLCQFVMVCYKHTHLTAQICCLCTFVTSVMSCCVCQENSQNAPLVHATLETLLRFLNWIPLGYIFETKLISTLVYKVTKLMSTSGTVLVIQGLSSCNFPRNKSQVLKIITIIIINSVQVYVVT